MKNTNIITSPSNNRAHPPGFNHTATTTRRPPGCWRSAGAALALMLVTGLAQASTVTVTTTADSGPGSLRQAIAQANSDDTIVIPILGPGLSTITLTSGELDIDKNLTITGPGADRLAVSANHASTVFVVLMCRCTIDGLGIIDGSSQDDFGGAGIQNHYGSLTVRNCTLSDNFSGSSGGGITSSGDLTVQNCTIANNVAQRQGGGILSHNGTLTVINSTLSGNFAVFSGGGIRNGGQWDGGTATVKDSTVNGNTAFWFGAGGGIDNGGTLTVINSTLNGNSAQWGAGIENWSTVTVNNSTLSGNLAQYASGIDNSYGTATVNNSTLSGNSAQYAGGGIGSAFGAVTVRNSTLSGNSAPDSSGIWNEYDSAPTVVLANSIVAGNPAASTGPDISSGIVLTSNGHNLIGNGDSYSYWPGDQVGTTASPLDPKLGPLQNNGGPTLTHALLPGSPAIDAGATADAVNPYGAPLTTDQRGIGFPRVLGAAVDIGAFEYGTPQQRITHLINEVNALTIQSGIKNALVVKLNAALADLGRGHTATACNGLRAFINLAEAQKGKALAANVADDLIAEVVVIESLLGCP